MKNYLNNAETKEMIIITQTRNLMQHFIDGSVMDKKEKTDFKKARTFIKKSLISMIKRLGEEQAKKFVRLHDSSKVLCITDSELKVLQKRKLAELDAAFEDNKEYFELVEITMDLNCKGCNKDFSKCCLYKHLDAQDVIPFDDEKDLGNCKFAYTIQNKV